MKASRLLSLLMLLQTRGRLTALALAEELEVSERTIYRDLEALSEAGVPVYAERGPGGGCALLEPYRTALTGMTPDEAQALLLLSIPDPLAALGFAPELRGALLKLRAALPRAGRERAAWRVHMDWSAWGRANEPPPHLQTLQRALAEERVLVLSVALPFAVRVEHRVAAWGLVAKGAEWYLVGADPETAPAVGAVADDVLRVIAVERIEQIELTEARCPAPPMFDLAAFWGRWRAAAEANRAAYAVRLRVSPEMLPHLASALGRPVDAARLEPADADGWRALTMTFESLFAARARILPLGRAVEVLAPLALRLSVADAARQVLSVYEPPPRPA